MIILDVTGMTCAHCIRAVTAAITALDAGARVSVDLAAGRVAAETTLPRATVAAAITAEGYAVKG